MSDDPEVAEIVAEINRHAKSDENIQDVLAMGRGLVKLFGYHKPRQAGLTRLSKRKYPELGLKCSYSWVRRLMKIAMDPKITNPAYWSCLPSARTSLLEIEKMSETRLKQGIHPDPERNGEIFITPTTNREDLKVYRMRDEEIEPPHTFRYVLVAIPLDRDQWEEGIDLIREEAFASGCDFMVAEVVSEKKKDRMFQDMERREIIWTLRQVERMKKPRETD